MCKPIGTVQYNAVFLASLCLPALSVVSVLVVILSSVPGGKAGDVNSSQTAGCFWREQQVALSLLSQYCSSITTSEDLPWDCGVVLCVVISQRLDGLDWDTVEVNMSGSWS